MIFFSLFTFSFLLFTKAEDCEQDRNCSPPDCSCFNRNSFEAWPLNNIPQFVMVTFDDAVNIVNMKTYETILKHWRTNKANGCPMRATFFVSHEYTDYQLVNKLYSMGQEIAVHSISHQVQTGHWNDASYDVWKREMVGMRDIISKYGLVPKNQIVGHRAPFLQTSGDVSMRMLNENGFLYDSSYPTTAFVNPPLWPYTFDYPAPNHDCPIPPCPYRTHPGLWEAPLVSWNVIGGNKCSMIDACTPLPTNASETFSFMRSNFERHYYTNRSPFPVFLHEGWLRDPERLEGFIDFINWAQEKDDVYLVSVKDAIGFIKNPMSNDYYRAQPCKPLPAKSRCLNTAFSCRFPNSHLGGERFMKSCIKCPKVYPWV